MSFYVDELKKVNCFDSKIVCQHADMNIQLLYSSTLDVMNMLKVMCR